jgi:ribonuclease HI
MFRRNTIYIYTDGSSLPRPRRGGIGIRYVYLGDNEEEFRIDLEEFGYQSATNNQMELKAVIFGLKKLHQQNIPIDFNLIEVRTDSQYITTNFNHAKYSWSKNQWKNKFGRPIENAILWKELINQIGKMCCNVQLIWFKGKSDIDMKAVDKSAKSSAKSILSPPIVPIKVRRKKSSNKTKRGWIDMKGQRINIHIITEEYMRLSKLSKYRYEVISKYSIFYNCVDFIYSELHHLKAGHNYMVTFNKDSKNPRILKMLEELN